MNWRSFTDTDETISSRTCRSITTADGITRCANIAILADTGIGALFCGATDRVGVVDTGPALALTVRLKSRTITSATGVGINHVTLSDRLYTCLSTLLSWAACHGQRGVLHRPTHTCARWKGISTIIAATCLSRILCTRTVGANACI